MVLKKRFVEYAGSKMDVAETAFIVGVILLCVLIIVGGIVGGLDIY